MTKEELKEFLRNNLVVKLDIADKMIRVSILLEQEVITTAQANLEM